MDHHQLEVFVGKLTEPETRDLFEIAAANMPQDIFLATLDSILTNGDREELMARWEEKA